MNLGSHNLSGISSKPSREAIEACIEVNDHFDKALYGEIQYVVELYYRHTSWGIFLQKKYVYTNVGRGEGN